ncbi:MAG: hypothetical protein AAGJ81_15980 [Verrucomicrobiota bacterium]
MKEELEKQLTAAARDYSGNRETLSKRIDALHAEIEAAKRRLLPGIRSAAAKCLDSKAKLERLIETNPKAFEKPRTVTLSGIKLGLQKQKGKITWKDPKALVKKIRSLFPQRADDLVEIKEVPRRAAINKLDVGDAKKLGLTIEADTDAVLIKSTTDDVDKLVAKLLDEEKTDAKRAA